MYLIENFRLHHQEDASACTNCHRLPFTPGFVESQALSKYCRPEITSVCQCVIQPVRRKNVQSDVIHLNTLNLCLLASPFICTIELFIFLCLDFNMFYVLLEYKNINSYDNVIILVNKQPAPLITGILTLTPIRVDLTSHSQHTWTQQAALVGTLTQIKYQSNLKE